MNQSFLIYFLEGVGCLISPICFVFLCILFFNEGKVQQKNKETKTILAKDRTLIRYDKMRFFFSCVLTFVNLVNIWVLE